MISVATLEWQLSGGNNAANRSGINQNEIINRIIGGSQITLRGFLYLGGICFCTTRQHTEQSFGYLMNDNKDWHIYKYSLNENTIAIQLPDPQPHWFHGNYNEPLKVPEAN